MGIKAKPNSTISTGEMRQKVTFLQNTPVSNGSGGFTDSFAEFYTCRGRLRRDSGRRALEVGELLNSTQFELVVRYNSRLWTALSPTMRVNDGVDNYTISGPAEKVDGLPHWIVLTLAKSNV